MSWKYKYFSEREMACKCGCGLLPADHFMERLEAMREEANFVFVVSSGARCPTYNASVSESGLDGPHTVGAADILVYGHHAYRLIGLAVKYGMTGIGVSQKGNISSRFIHLDDLPGDEKHPRPWSWSY